MLRYAPGALPETAARALRNLQDQVDTAGGHADKVAAAARLWGRKPRRAFTAVRVRLAAVSPPGEACFYCERDRYRDIEHMRPKRHYPGQAFDWTNYVYACAICNQDRKSDRFAVVSAAGELLAFDRSLPLGQEPPAGIAALIDIRAEDPLALLQLDLETGAFVARASDGIGALRAAFTRDLFDLNSPDLTRIRRQMRDHVLGYVDRHEGALAAGDDAQAARIADELRSLPHPTVLHEVGRQRDAPVLSRWREAIARLPSAVWLR